MGRSKDMIIRGGQNIYPAEIEGILNEHPKITNVAVVGYPDKEMGERTCAYAVLKAGETLDKRRDGCLFEREETVCLQTA